MELEHVREEGETRRKKERRYLGWSALEGRDPSLYRDDSVGMEQWTGLGLR